MKCGLLGRTLSHSYSPKIHSLLGNYSYELVEKEPEELDSFFSDFPFDGLNVTIPYKRAVLPYCTMLTPQAQRLGSVNTVVKQPDGTLLGHNTDYFGFTSMVRKSGLTIADKKVLVLGSGGASVTAAAVLQELGANVITVSRTGETNYNNLSMHQDAALIVNCTPVGMYPNTGDSPVDLDIFPKLEGVLDLVYNPARTKLLLDAETRGLVAENGLWMLVAQAKESAEWFCRKKVPDAEIFRIYKTLEMQMQNIVLIGMPGCGKSTVGALLAACTGREFVDADAEIIKTAGMSIPEIFSSFGEAGFRKIETEVLEAIGKRSGLVIATGGGCVTREENYAPLHQNGRIIYIERDLSKLPTAGRPLSQAGNLEEMFGHRQPLYECFADFTVCNNGEAADTVNQILSLLKLENDQ